MDGLSESDRGRPGVPVVASVAEGDVISLDGTWRIADGVAPDQIPHRFDHTVAVPGLVNQSQPACCTWRISTAT